MVPWCIRRCLKIILFFYVFLSLNGYLLLLFLRLLFLFFVFFCTFPFLFADGRFVAGTGQHCCASPGLHMCIHKLWSAICSTTTAPTTMSRQKVGKNCITTTIPFLSAIRVFATHKPRHRHTSNSCFLIFALYTHIYTCLSAYGKYCSEKIIRECAAECFNVNLLCFWIVCFLDFLRRVCLSLPFAFALTVRICLLNFVTFLPPFFL